MTSAQTTRTINNLKTDLDILKKQQSQILQQLHEQQSQTAYLLDLLRHYELEQDLKWQLECEYT